MKRNIKFMEKRVLQKLVGELPFEEKGVGQNERNLYLRCCANVNRITANLVAGTRHVLSNIIIVYILIYGRLKLKFKLVLSSNSSVNINQRYISLEFGR